LLHQPLGLVAAAPVQLAIGFGPAHRRRGVADLDVDVQLVRRPRIGGLHAVVADMRILAGVGRRARGLRAVDEILRTGRGPRDPHARAEFAQPRGRSGRPLVGGERGRARERRGRQRLLRHRRVVLCRVGLGQDRRAGRVDAAVSARQHPAEGVERLHRRPIEVVAAPQGSVRTVAGLLDGGAARREVAGGIVGSGRRAAVDDHVRIALLRIEVAQERARGVIGRRRWISWRGRGRPLDRERQGEVAGRDGDRREQGLIGQVDRERGVGMCRDGEHGQADARQLSLPAAGDGEGLHGHALNRRRCFGNRLRCRAVP